MNRPVYIPIDYDHLVLLASQMGHHIDRSEATISVWCVGHARLFQRLRKSMGCAGHTYRKVMEWFSENWPEDLEWPSAIARPDIKKGDAA